MLCKAKVQHYNSVVYSENQVNTILHEGIFECPRKRPKSHLEPNVKVPCCSRTCPYVGCREEWAKKEKQFLHHASKQVVFNYYPKCVPDNCNSPSAGASKIRDVLKKVQRWCAKNNETFNCKLYPEQTSKGKLHWQGPMSVSSKHVIAHLRKIWAKVNGRAGPTLTCAKMWSKHGWKRYAVKEGARFGSAGE